MRMRIRDTIACLLEALADPLQVVAAAIVVVLILLTVGCSEAPIRSEMGHEIVPPTGFTTYCIRYPKRLECGGNE